VVKFIRVALQCCVLRTLKEYNYNLLFIVHMFMFGSDWLLLLWIVQGCDNICSVCLKLYLGP